MGDEYVLNTWSSGGKFSTYSFFPGYSVYNDLSWGGGGISIYINFSGWEIEYILFFGGGG